MVVPSSVALIDKLRDELYKSHSWTGETAVKFMVPIILALRQLDGELLKSGKVEKGQSLAKALQTLRKDKRDLDHWLARVRNDYSHATPLLQQTLDEMIAFVGSQTDGVIYDVLDYLTSNQSILNSFRDEDFIGTLFERAVSDVFRGDDGRFFTPRNAILIVREMLRLFLKKTEPERHLTSYTVCDPCCGSARFLVGWSELIKAELTQLNPALTHSDVLASLRTVAEAHLFGADLHSDTAAYGCLNMMLHGDGATNITSHDSLNHFGFFTDVPLLKGFAKEFGAGWSAYRKGEASHRDDLLELLARGELLGQNIAQCHFDNTIDLSSAEWKVLNQLIYVVLELDRVIPVKWPSVSTLRRRFKHRPVFEVMLSDWATRNSTVSAGFDVVMSNPPFGRQKDLMEDDPHILCQYKLATELWVWDLPRNLVEKILGRLYHGEPPAAYYQRLLGKYYGQFDVRGEDEIAFRDLPGAALKGLMERHGLVPGKSSKGELATTLELHLGRLHVASEDCIAITDLSPNLILKVCVSHLYQGSKPGDAIVEEITLHFGKEWLTVEDILGQDGYSSKATLSFAGHEHSIYYDKQGSPIVLKSPLPKQVLFVEQFLRMVKDGGKVFAVFDIGVLNNVGDEYVRQFIRRNAYVHAAVEFLHGAFKAAEANVRTAILLMEKHGEADLDGPVFLSFPQYLGFRLNDQRVPPLRENDLGKVLCDFSVSLGLGTLMPNNCGGDLSGCAWCNERRCTYWLKNVDPTDGEYPSQRQHPEFDLLSTVETRQRAYEMRRLDPKYYVFERRFEQLSTTLSREGIATKSIRQIAKEPIRRGTQPDYDDIEGTIPVLKTVDVQNRKIDWDACRRVSSGFCEANQTAVVRQMDIVMTSTGEGSWGRAAMVDRYKALVDSHLTILRVNPEEVDPYSVLAFLWSDYGRMQFEQRVRGSTGQTEVYVQDIETIKVFIPKEPEQMRIRADLEEHFELMERAQQLHLHAVNSIDRLLGGSK